MNGADDAPRRAYQILVLVALGAMLLGTVLLIAAREPLAADIGAGERATVLRIDAGRWDPMREPFEVRVFLTHPGTANVSVTGSDGGVERTLTTNDARLVVRGVAEPGEAAQVEVLNEGPGAVRVTGEVSHRSTYAVGGAFVALGLLGFVFYRIGMS